MRSSLSEYAVERGRDVPLPRLLRDLGVRRLPRRRVPINSEPVRGKHQAQAGTLHQGTEGEGCHPQTGILAGTGRVENIALHSTELHRQSP